MTVSLLVPAIPVMAQVTFNWTGSTSTDWFTGSNWDSGTVPTANEVVTLDTITPNPSVIDGGDATVLRITVGVFDAASLTLMNGGTLTSGADGTDGDIGFDGGSSGEVTVTGTGSSWTHSGIVGVGRHGTGQLFIESGGTVNMPDVRIGDQAGGQGTAIVRGAGSMWTSGSAAVGNAGAGTLTIADSGTVSTPQLGLAIHAGSTGTVNIGAPAGDAAVAPGILDGQHVGFGAGAGTLNFNHTATDYVFAAPLTGAGEINVLAGNTRLTGDSTVFAGTTQIQGGTLNVAEALGGTLEIQANGRLEGTGTVGAIANNGTVAPGDSIGTLQVSGDYSQTATGTFEVEIEPGGTTSDLLDIAGSANLGGGTVSVSLASGNYAPGARFPILTAAEGVTGAFANLIQDNPDIPLELVQEGNTVFLVIPPPVLTFQPASLAFGDVEVGETSPPQMATLRNTGGSAATLSFSTPEGGFSADTGACGSTLAAGASCQVSVTFSPSATGAAEGTLTVESAQGATVTLALSGTGVAPSLTFTPASLAFGEVPVGTTSEPMSATLENTGSGAASALSFRVPGAGFEADTSNCGTSLAAGASCEVTVTFTPAAAGPVERVLAVDSAEDATATLDVSGGTVTFRYDFAEGATGYFTTTLGLFNPDRAAAAHVQVRLLPEGGAPVPIPITLTPFGRASVDVNAALGNRATGVAAVVTSDRPIAPIRQMSWDDTTFGSTLESGAPGPSTTHYFAEGATTLWELFYLLSNDNDTPAEVTIEYLRDDGTRIPQTLTVAAHARQSVWVNAVPGMANAQAGAIIRSDVPIAAERSMYFTAGEAPWSAGASSRGAHAPDDTWYFAEGATDFFDDFLLLMNPDTTQDATVEVRYQLADGRTIPITHVVPRQSRRTILVEAEDPALRDQLMAAMTVTSGVPIVAERAMWWGPTAASWYESHASVGSVEPGTVWAIGEAWTGGLMAEDAFVLLANAAGAPGQVRVTLVYDDGSSDEREATLAANGRATLLLSELFPASADRRFSVLVESLGAAPVPIIVDVSRYQSTGGRFGNAGGSTTATKIR